MSEFPLKLNNYFFTHQEVVADPDHKMGDKHPTNNEYNLEVTVSKNTDTCYGAELTITLNKELSINPAYAIKISTFGIFDVISEKTPENIDELAKLSASQLLISATRERVAELTARGPWPMCLIDFVNLQLNQKQ